MAITIRQSGDRGYFDHDWLKTYHTFSFANYYNPSQMGFRSLRVINEDRVKPATGFPLHFHKDMEIFSVILEGGLAHQDDMGNGSILRPGYIQLMSAGRGVTHSEYNASNQDEVHFLQIWIIPEIKGLEPSYQELFFPESAKHNRWCLIISKNGQEDSLKIHQDVKVYLAHMDQGVSLVKEIALHRYGWLQVMRGSVDLNGQRLERGDGASISEMAHLEIKAQAFSQLLFFDLN